MTFNDIKIIKQVKWFDRKFEFAAEQNIFPAILERLAGTSLRLEYKINQMPAHLLTLRWYNTWSIQENVGHLIDLEPLWQGRLQDILDGKEEIRPTDLANRRTDEANHNSSDITELLTQFQTIRGQTMAVLETLEEADVFKFALHPRLKTPMRTMDLFLFVAEHDDHHLARMTELSKSLGVNGL